MTFYTKKPVTIEAMQFTDETKDQVFNFITCNKQADFDEDGTPILKIQTLEGVMTARFGDYVIKGVNGEFYPCKPDIFHKTYDEVCDVKYSKCEKCGTTMICPECKKFEDAPSGTWFLDKNGNFYQKS